MGEGAKSCLFREKYLEARLQSTLYSLQHRDQESYVTTNFHCLLYHVELGCTITWNFLSPNNKSLKS